MLEIRIPEVPPSVVVPDRGPAEIQEVRPAPAVPAEIVLPQQPKREVATLEMDV